MDKRHQARRLSLAYLYALSASNINQKSPYFEKKLKIKDYDKKLFNKIVEGYTKNKEELNNIVQEYLSSWSKDQLLELDLITIKIAVLEYLVLKSIPVKVAVNEAVELAKEFGTEKSGKFVNGVLAKIIKDQEQN